MKLKQIAAGASAALLVGAASAQTVLPAEASSAFATLKGQATELIGLGWPLVVVVAGGLALMGLFKKVLGRAT